MNIREVLALAPVIPVLVVEKLESAAPLAKALYAGGLTVLEITLRTPVALAVIEAMRVAVPQAIIGAGGLPISGLWLWGGGPACAIQPRVLPPPAGDEGRGRG